MKNDITKIANGIYISSDKDKLPKDSLLLEHRYIDKIKVGELGIFAVKTDENFYGQWNNSFDFYGTKILYISIGKNVKIKTIRSTKNYLEDTGELEKPNGYINKKYGYKNYSELIYNGLELAELDNPSDVYYELQKKTIATLKENGEQFDVLEMLYEDAESPHQYIITNIATNIRLNEGGVIKCLGTFKSLGTSKELGIMPKII